MMKAVEMQRKESGESHSSEELQTKLTGILIETLYRFEGSEEMKNLQKLGCKSKRAAEAGPYRGRAERLD